MFVVKVFRRGWTEIIDFCDTANEADEIAISISTEDVMYIGWVQQEERKIIATKTFYCATGFPEMHKYRHGDDLIYNSCVEWLSKI